MAYHDTDTPRPLPANTHAEEAVIGAVLLNREAIIVIASWLQPEHFWVERNACIYAAALDCYQRHIPPDIATVSEALRRSGKLDSVGGIPGLIALSTAAPTSAHVEYYAQIIEKAAMHRRVITAGGRIASLGFDEKLDAPDLESAVQQELTKALVRKSDANTVALRTLADRAYQRLKQRDSGGVSTGFSDLDRIIGGFRRGEVAIIAGRPSMGKTAFMLSLAYNIAKRGERVDIFSLEMTEDQLFDRLACIDTNLCYNDTFEKGGIYHDENAQRLYTAAMGRLSDMPMLIDDTPALSIGDMQRRALLNAHEHGPPAAIFVDYLQLMSVPGMRHGDEYATVTAASKAMTVIAKMVGAPVIALSQLSRESERRSDHKPNLSDLRGSGQIEQDAARVLFPYREEVYDPDTDKKGYAEIIVAKNRNGPTGTAVLRFDGPPMRFHNMSADWNTPEGY